MMALVMSASARVGIGAIIVSGHQVGVDPPRGACVNHDVMAGVTRGKLRVGIDQCFGQAVGPHGHVGRVLCRHKEKKGDR